VLREHSALQPRGCRPAPQLAPRPPHSHRCCARAKHDSDSPMLVQRPRQIRSSRTLVVGVRHHKQMSTLKRSSGCGSVLVCCAPLASIGAKIRSANNRCITNRFIRRPCNFNATEETKSLPCRGAGTKRRPNRSAVIPCSPGLSVRLREEETVCQISDYFSRHSLLSPARFWPNRARPPVRSPRRCKPA